MKNAFTSAEIDLLDQKYQAAKWRLAIHNPRHLAYAQIAATPQSYPASVLSIAGWTGSSQLIQKNSLAWIGTAPHTSDIGTVRIRGNVTAGVAPIAEAGSGLINFREGTSLNYYVTVLEQYLPLSKHVRYDYSASQWRMDYDQVHASQLTTMRPYVNMGAPVVGILSGGKFTASFVGGDSLFWDSPVSTQIWRFPDGQTVSSLLGTSANPVVMTFSGASPGGSYISLELTNSAGGSAIGRRLIFLYDSYEQAERTWFTPINGGYNQGGFKTSVESVLFKNHVPYDLNEVVIFENALYGSTNQSIGGNAPYRQNVVMRGFITDTLAQINPYAPTVSMTIETIDGVIDLTTAYDVFLVNETPNGASHWVQMRNLSMDRVAAHILQDRSTISEVADFHPASGVAIDGNIMLYQNLPKGSIWSQLRTNYNERGYKAIISSDMQSSLYAFPDAKVTGGSVNEATVMTIKKGNRAGVPLIRNVAYDRSAQVQLYAVTSDIPLGAESPGGVIGYFGGRTEIARGLTVQNQDQLIAWAGNIRADMNSKFPNVSVPLAGNIRIDPVPQSLARMTLSGVDVALRTEWLNKPFYIENINLQPLQTTNAVLTTVDLAEVTDGKGGSAITFPSTSNINFPPPPSPPPPIEPPPPPTSGGSGFGTVYVATPTTLYRTRAFSAASPTYSSLYDHSVSSDWNNDFILDPWSPATRGFQATRDGIIRWTNLDTESPTSEYVILATDLATSLGVTTVDFIMKVFASINVQDYIGFAFRGSKTTATQTRGVYYAYSTDGGDNWNISTIISLATTTAYAYSGAIDYVPHLVGGQVVIYVAFTRNNLLYVYKSSNSGSSWSLVGDPSTQYTTLSRDNSLGAFCVHCPYHNNDSGAVAYVGNAAGWHSAAKDSSGVIKTTDSGSNWDIIRFEGIQPTSGDRDLFPSGIYCSRHGIETHPTNSNLVVAYPRADTYLGMYTSTDGASTWTKVTNGLPASYTSFTKGVGAAGGFPTNTEQIYLVASMFNDADSEVYVSTDSGLSWTVKTGNIAQADLNDDGTANQRGMVIVPLWTE